MSAIDLLYEAVEKKGHVCAGLDTAYDYVPAPARRSALNDAEAVLSFNKALIDALKDAAACFKVQIAYYEEMGLQGLRAYSETLKYIRNSGCLAIADIKRGDIADTAQRYAKAHYSGDLEADFVTLNPYMGMDSIEPWFKEANARKKGAFIIMRTSNPGMKDFEYLSLSNGNRLYHEVGDKISALADQQKSRNGYGLFGIVVGCTQRDEAEQIRKKYNNLFFLVPGYGAQGGKAADAALLLKNGNGGVINASRSIITAWQNEENSENADNAFAASCAYRAAVKMRDEILSEIKK